MNNSGDPAVWSYTIDLSTLTIPSNGDYFITVGGNDIAGNTYTNASGAQDGNETEWTESPLHITNHLLLF